MTKQNKLSKSLKITTIQETVGSNFAKYLKETTSTRDTRAILNLMIKRIIRDTGVPFIPVDDFIEFYSKIPLKHWATRPIFYHRDEKWDALGFLGERVHQYTLISKTLAFYFYDVLDMHITHIMDNKEPKFIHIENPKDRMLAALYYLKENSKRGELSRAFNKARQILSGRYYV